MAAVTTGTHRFEVVKWISAPGSDPATGEWHYNLDTEATSTTRGTWQIRVTLSDGSVHTAFVSVK